jgi:hypothetical protein
MALLDLLWAATRERFGVVVSTNNPDRLRQLLYTVRRSHAADFANLGLTTTPGRVWIINKEGLVDADQPDPS